MKEKKVRLEINEEVFKDLMDGVKHCVAKGYSGRPILEYIKVVVKKESIIFYALDGYRAGRCEAEFKSETEFECFIKPITVKCSKGEPQNVVIEYDGKAAAVEVVTEYGWQRYIFKNPCNGEGGGWVNLETIYEDSRKHETQTAANAHYVAQACRALGRYDCKNGMIIIGGKSNNTQPFIIKAKNERVKNEQLILPLRVFEDWQGGDNGKQET